MALFPDKTVNEVKPLIGSNTRVRIGDKEYLSQEISAMIWPTEVCTF